MINPHAIFLTNSIKKSCRKQAIRFTDSCVAHNFFKSSVDYDFGENHPVVLKKDSTFLDIKAMGTRAQHKRIII
jgi:hypothetical protein